MSAREDIFWPPSTNGAPVPYGTATEELAAIVRGPWPECWNAYPALARDGSAPARQILAEQAGSADWRHRRLAVQWLGACATRDEHALILKLTEDANERVRKEAICACGVAPVPASFGRLVAMLRSGSGELRIAAAEALGDLGDRSAFSALERAAASARDEPERRAAVRSLALLVDGATWPRVFQLLALDAFSKHRRWACALAEENGDGAILPDLERLSADHDGHVRKAAARAIDAINVRRE